MREVNTDRKTAGRYGEYGGQYAPETLMVAVRELERVYGEARMDPAFMTELEGLLKKYAGRPSLLYHAARMSEDLGCRVLLKREDLNHTGSHKINNVLGQALLARRMGKRRVIAETGAGQHGVATATAAALFGMECEIFMGTEDMERQRLNVYRMRLLGASVTEVTDGTGTLKDATSEAMRAWSASVDNTYYVIGSVMGPHPYPAMVRDFQSVIGKEILAQARQEYECLPTAVIACIGGGSNAMGSFFPFLPYARVRLIGAEAGGEGLDTGRHAATMAQGTTGVFHGMKSLFLQDEEGQILPVHSISAGLDYPGVGPEHAWLASTGRAEYHAVTDSEAVEAFEYLSKKEGIIPAIESAHAIALARRLSGSFNASDTIVVTVSGRGDKDVESVGRYRGQL